MRFFEKIKKNHCFLIVSLCLVKFLETKYKSFWVKIWIKKYQIKFNRNFFRTLFIANFVYMKLLLMLNVSSFLQNFRKFFWVRFQKYEQAFGQIWVEIPQFGPSNRSFEHIKYSNFYFVTAFHHCEECQKNHGSYRTQICVKMSHLGAIWCFSTTFSFVSFTLF